MNPKGFITGKNKIESSYAHRLVKLVWQEVANLQTCYCIMQA